ncbi:MAG: alpha/beta hydrolase [Bacteroidota bacterium]
MQCRVTVLTTVLLGAVVLAGCATGGQAPLVHHEVVGTGPAVVVLHGGPGVAHDYLRPEWDRLAAAGYRVIYYDQRGCGRSPGAPQFRWKRDVEDLDRLLGRVSPDGPVVLAGSSWGPHLALLFARERPDRVRALVLSGTPPWPDWAAHLETSDELSRVLVESGARTPAQIARTDSLNSGLRPSALPPPDSVALVAAGLPPVLAGRIAAHPTGNGSCPDVWLSKMAEAHTLPPMDSLAAVRAPTLLVEGTRFVPRAPDGSRSVAAVIPNARVVSVNAGHDPWLEAPDEFFRVVTDFLNGLGSAGTANQSAPPGAAGER